MNYKASIETRSFDGEKGENRTKLGSGFDC